MVKTIYQFDEPALLSGIEGLPPSLRTSFALSVAQRLISIATAYDQVVGENLGNRMTAEITRLWDEIRSGAIHYDRWLALEEWLGGILPEDIASLPRPLVLLEDTVATFRYALRTLQQHDQSQNAVWAAKRAYECADQGAIWMLGNLPDSPAAEQEVRAHPFVQRELARQNRDLALLVQGKLIFMLEQQGREEILTNSEIEVLASSRPQQA